ncbi:MAG: hypothetical protein II625_05265 [Bacilli bacterium]|nr:hypothetical protein [Bacilli bacterium]
MNLRLNYDTLDKRVRSRSSVNLDDVVMVRRREKSWIYILIILVAADLIHYFIARTINNFTGFIVMIFFIAFGISVITSRIGGLGMSVKTFIYVRYSNVLFREKSVEIIKNENIQYLDVKNHLFSTSVDLRYIDNMGRANEINFSIPKYLIDKNRKRFLLNRKNICERLISLQKVLDKGDF